MNRTVARPLRARQRGEAPSLTFIGRKHDIDDRPKTVGVSVVAASAIDRHDPARIQLRHAHLLRSARRPTSHTGGWLGQSLHCTTPKKEQVVTDCSEDASRSQLRHCRSQLRPL
jgi:hypothetical protein